jgi:large subunit ribosomal protein L23
MKDKEAIIKRALLTERGSIYKTEQNKYIFEVAKEANKLEIKKAIESFFGVKVLDVTTMMTHGKIKRLGRFEGRRPDWKKAIVTLKEGDKIELVEGV